MQMIDAHIHLDQYTTKEMEGMLEGTDWLEALVSVSKDLDSSKRNLLLSRNYPKVKPAFGFHPEQGLPTEIDLMELIEFMNQHQAEMIAVGEVGLPYYLRMDHRVSKSQYGQYVEQLEVFIEKSVKWDKPVVLHAVYDDAPIVCDLLEKHSVKKAHFHWFKGDEKTVTRMNENGYLISVTPEIVYKEKIQKLVETYPLEQIMIETDGPWPFEGPFSGKMTHPVMMRETILMMAKIKKLSTIEMWKTVLENTKRFYKI